MFMLYNAINAIIRFTENIIDSNVGVAFPHFNVQYVRIYGQRDDDIYLTIDVNL